MGVIVSVLSILVSFLVGWQIYKSVENTEKVRSIERMQSSLREKISSVQREGDRLNCLVKVANALSLVEKQPLSAYRIIWHAFIDALEYNDMECVNGVLNNLETIGRDIVSKERGGKFIYDERMRADLREVERITDMEMTEAGLFPAVRERYYGINRDIKLCVENIKYQVLHKRVRDYVNFKFK